MCGDAGRHANAENLLSQHPRFLLARDEAEAIIADLESCVTERWYEIARAAGVSEADCERIASAFAYPGFRYLAQRGSGAGSMLRWGAMVVSASDREFMRRIGEAKADSHAEAAARHRALPLRERLRRSWALYLAGRSTPDPALREDDPTPFYERARALGLYRP